MSKRRFSLKKTFHLAVEGKNRDRLLDAAKHDIRKYAKRERSKALPEGVDFWDFECKVGASVGSSTSVHFAEVMGAVDALVVGGADQFYIEINSKAGHRIARPTSTADSNAATPAL